MECRDVSFRLWEYLDQELGPEESLAVAEHLTGCSDCYPAHCWCRALLEVLERQRNDCSAPASLVTAIRVRLRTT
jgi:hypothetical protein